MEFYQGGAPHRPLPETPTAFRLVILHPGTFEQDIVCDLLVTDLQAGYRYEALSYCWGDPQQTEAIFLEGVEFNATVNLVAALRYLRNETTSRTLWVDGLCINQKDLLERSMQVKRMIEIYRRATRTLAWLGVPATSMSGVRDFLTRVTCSIQTPTEPAGYELREAADTDAAMTAFGLVEAPWFCRIWVVQEVAVAREVTIVCGDVSFPWEIFINGLSAVGNSESACHTIRIRNRWHESTTKLATFCREYIHDAIFQRHFQQTPLADRLLSLLLASNGHQASDLRDHIFALLGLAGSNAQLAQHRDLEVDYSRSVGEVLKRVAIFLFEKTSDPFILYGAGVVSADSQLQLGLPSWVPTWQGTTHYFLEQYFEFERPLYRKPQDPVGEIRLSEDEGTLMVRGGILCRVTRVGRKAEKGSEANSWAEQARSLFAEWERYILEPVIDGYGKAFALAHFRGLLNADDAEALAAGTEDKLRAYRYWEETIFHDRGQREAYNGFDQHLYSVLMGRETGPPPGEFAGFELNRLSGGAPFATSNGLFGFFNNASMLENGLDAVVCLFQGCRAPFLLQAGPETYRLLGPCYITPYIDLRPSRPFEDFIALA